jgi:mitochondrial fusion and transport protein UGO1
MHIMYEEGVRAPSVPSTPHTQPTRGRSTAPRRQEKRGQGVKGVVRGWRVGFWALIGIYATAGLSGSGQQEF